MFDVIVTIRSSGRTVRVPARAPSPGAAAADVLALVLGGTRQGWRDRLALNGHEMVYREFTHGGAPCRVSA